MGELRIIKRNGNIDAVLRDGKYLLISALITIDNGKIKYIDNGEWINLDDFHREKR